MNNDAPAPRRPLRRRLAGVGALLAITAFGLVGGASPASAISQDPLGPTASISTECRPYGGVFDLLLANPGGGEAAYFTITYDNGGSVTHYLVAPDEAQHVVRNLPDGGNDTVTVEVALDKSFEVGPLDCNRYLGGIALTCVGGQPTLTGTYANDGESDVDVTMSAGGSNLAVSSYQEQKDLTLEVADHQPFTATLSIKGDGTFATLTGTPDCVPVVTTTTSTTSTPSTTTSTTSSVPVSVISADPPTPPAPPTPGAPAAPMPADVALARTGTTTWPLIGAGVTLIGLGVAFRRRAARLV